MGQTCISETDLHFCNKIPVLINYSLLAIIDDNLTSQTETRTVTDMPRGINLPLIRHNVTKPVKYI